MSVYAFIDVSRKQEFIYRHNELKKNLLNSFVIKAVTESDRSDAAIDNGFEDASSPLDWKVESGTTLPVSLSGYLNKVFPGQYEFEFSGGGNSIVRFKEKKAAAEFVRGFSKEVLKAYPELELYISVVEESELHADQRGKDMIIRNRLLHKADQLKDKRRAVFRRWTYGVEDLDDTGKAKLTRDDNWDFKLARRMIGGLLEKKLENSHVKLTYELQDYKKQADGKSYIGIVAIDGNRMGEMVRRIGSFEQLRSFSSLIEHIYVEAVAQALLAGGDNKSQVNAAPFLVTPVVLAGDDICLILEGEYAIQAGAQIVKNIKAISEQTENLQKLKDFTGESHSLSACAGVTIVKVTYPFYDAVKAAEELCRRSKEAMHHVDQGEDQGQPVSASFIDWHIVQGQVMSQKPYHAQIRHQSDDECFHIKPLRIDQEKAYEHGRCSYDAFERMLNRISVIPHSGSVLAQVKTVLYNGWIPYKLFFETNKMEVSQDISKIVSEELSEFCTVNYGVIQFNSETNGKSYTYVLNDILEAMDFMAIKERASDTNA